MDMYLEEIDGNGDKFRISVSIAHSTPTYTVR